MHAPPTPSRSAAIRNTAVVALFVSCVLFTLWSLLQGGLLGVFFSRDLTPADKLAQLRADFDALGTAAPLAYVFVVVVEVVLAPLPGALLYAPGGVIFGGFWGGLLSLVGNVVGSAIACQLMRIFGGRIADRLLRKQSLRDLRERVADHGVWVVLVLRINPLTSSDLVSYAAGLTPMPTWKLCLGTALGAGPLCWIQSYTADRLLTVFPTLLYPLLALCGVYTVVAIVIVWRLLTRSGNETKGTDKIDKQDTSGV